MDVELENIKAVAATYSLVLSLDLPEMWISFSELEKCWSLELRTSGIEVLSATDQQKISSILADKIKEILSFDDKKLLVDLNLLRKSWINNLLIQASKLLDISDQTKLRKMVILQNIATGSKPNQKPWEKTSLKASPKRRASTEKVVRRDLNLSVN